MSKAFPFENNSDLTQWHQGIENANRNNIFCHCRACGHEWADSSFDVTCPKCSSKNIESISCWQFPDD